jgi:hypothetical protein
MGNWHISIDGHGVHDNDMSYDVNERLRDFIAQLLNDGHVIHHTSLTIGGARKLELDEHGRLDYRYLP